MTKHYHIDGTPISALKKTAKKMAQETGQKLSEAQEAVARECGVSSFGQLVGESIFFEEGELSLQRKVEGVLHIYEVEDVLDDMEQAFNAETEALNDLWIHWSVEYGEDAPVIVQRLKASEPEMEVPGTYQRFTPASRVPLEEFDSAASLMEYGDASGMVELLNEIGIYSHELQPQVLHGEHEGLLQLALLKSGLELGERILVNLYDSKDPIGAIDHDRRAFVNALSDGGCVVSNGGSTQSELKHAILSSEELAELRGELAAARSAHKAGVWTNADAEAIIYAAVLDRVEHEEPAPAC